MIAPENGVLEAGVLDAARRAGLPLSFRSKGMVSLCTLLA